MDRNALVVAAGLGAAVQAGLVLLGHLVPFVADNLFAIGGAVIALLAGLVYARRSGGVARPMLGGGCAGLVSAVVGVLLAAALGDVPWIMLPFGALAGFVAGLLGASLAGLMSRAAPASASPERR